jgi:hypothetical protein
MAGYKPTPPSAPTTSLLQRAQAERDRQIQQARDAREARLRAAREAQAAHLRSATDLKQAEIQAAQRNAATTKQPANDHLQEARVAWARSRPRARTNSDLAALHHDVGAPHHGEVGGRESARADYHSIASIPEAGFQQVFDAMVSAGYGLTSIQGYEFRLSKRRATALAGSPRRRSSSLTCPNMRPGPSITK